MQQDNEEFINKEEYNRNIELEKYGENFLNILDHLKYDDIILKIIAWQMKWNNRPYEKEAICHGCK